MNEVTIFAATTGILLLLALWARSGRAQRGARAAAQLAVGSVAAFESAGVSRTDQHFEAPTRLGDDLTIAPVSNLSLHVVECRAPDGPPAGVNFSLSDGVNTVGRRPTSEPQVHLVAIEADRAISTDHLYIESGSNGRLTVTDRGSRNGTRLNGRRIDPETPVEIAVGDLLTIGNTTLRLESSDHESLESMIRLVPKYHFKVIGGPAREQSWAMNADRFRIGRGRECDWQLPDDQISRVHAEVQREGELVRIIDQSSANGLFVNGRRYQSRVLDAGDVVKLGNTEIRFERALG